MTTYAIANDRGSRAREILDSHIQKNLSKTQDVLEQVENMAIHDQIVKGSALDFGLQGADVLNEILEAQTPAKDLKIITGEEMRGIHDFALGQIAEKTGVPLKFARDLQSRGAWGTNLLAENFRTIFQHGNGTRYLVRSVGDQVRGFLSDRYKRLDARPIIDAFVGECRLLGVLPINGFALDTQIALQVILPTIYEPVAGEPIVVGLQFKTSDFGNGALSLNIMFIRVTCMNGAVGESLLKQVHIGRQIDDIAYSQETIDLDTRATASKVKDITRFAFDPEQIGSVVNMIKRASEEEVKPRTIAELLKTKLTKTEIEAAVEAFTSPDIVNLPAGQTKYRLSNAISWISQAADVTPERRLELDAFAGELLGKFTGRQTVEI